MRVVSTWVEDDDPGLARTMSVLDRELARGQQLSGFFDALLGILSVCRRAAGAHRRHRDTPDDDVAA